MDELATGQVWRLRLPDRPLRTYAIYLSPKTNQILISPAHRTDSSWFVGDSTYLLAENFDWSSAELVDTNNDIDYGPLEKI